MRAVRARRRWLVAALVGGSVVFGLEAVAPPSPPTHPVVVAAADLPPGRVLTAADLRAVAWPDGLVPAGALDTAAAAVGRRLAGAVGRGEAVTTLRLVGPALADLLAAAGRVAAPVRLADADAAGLLRPGDVVDLVAARAGAADPVSGVGATSATVVAGRATVLTVPEQEEAGPFGGQAPTGAGALVVVSVTRTEALALAEAAVLGPVSVVLVG